MKSIKEEQTTTVKIYREFFAKAQVEVKKQLSALKTSSFCTNCRKCCRLRYSELSPSELLENGLEDFLNVFIPLGYSNNEKISIEENQKLAVEIDENYAKNAIKNSQKA